MPWRGNDYTWRRCAGAPGAPVARRDCTAGVPAAAAEAMAFSLMGRNTLRGEPNQLPQCTGVESPAVLGVVHGVEWWDGRR